MWELKTKWPRLGRFHIGPSAFSLGVKLLSVHDPMSETREKREENKDE